MVYDVDTWLMMVKLDLWTGAHVKNVGFVKAYGKQNGDAALNYCSEDELDGACRLGNQMLLTACGLIGAQGSKEEYRLCVAVRHPFKGVWEKRVLQLICQQHETWVQTVRGNSPVKDKNQNVYQISKKSAFELKDRSNYSVYGRELPSPRRFKS